MLVPYQDSSRKKNPAYISQCDTIGTVNSCPSYHDSHQLLHRILAEFRHQLRTYLLASEKAAHGAGLHPQQHQLLLAVAGAPPDVCPSIAYAAELLGLKHNSAVELVDRCERQGLLRRATDPNDRRRVRLEVTSRGQQVLDRLSQVHLRELFSLGPHLIQSLQEVLRNEVGDTRASVIEPTTGKKL